MEGNVRTACCIQKNILPIDKLPFSSQQTLQLFQPDGVQLKEKHREKVKIKENLFN